MSKRAGYYLFTVFFSFFRLFPLQKNKIFFVATHDDGAEGNVGLVAEAIRKRMPEKKLVFLTRKDGIRHPFSFFGKKAYHLATAAVIFMDNVFMPMAFTPISKKAKVVQLWHGTGTIKKFGLDSEPEEVMKLGARANRRITHLIVSSEKTKKQYAQALGVPEDRVYVLGLPRTDLVLDREKMEQNVREFYKEYPELKDKKCVLYAPTFRDSEVEAPKLALELHRFLSVMREEEVLLLRLHPFVAANNRQDFSEFGNRVWNMSDYHGVSTLMAVSSCLITDYSSIVYEYCLLDRPMIFFAYDLDEFEKNGRSFYEDYEELVPGPVVKSQPELERLWQSGVPKSDKWKAFRAKAYRYMDKNATKRLLELIFEEK